MECDGKTMIITITLTVDDDEEEEDNDEEEEEKEQNVDDDDDDIRLAKENWCVGLGGPGRGKVWVSRPGVHCHPHRCNQHQCHPHHCNQHHCHHDHQSGY